MKKLQTAPSQEAALPNSSFVIPHCNGMRAVEDSSKVIYISVTTNSSSGNFTASLDCALRATASVNSM